jgi:beta-lactamase regulating signal transducer with metallopeptidase domain
LTLAHFLWQGALIWLLLSAIQIPLRRSSSNQRYWTNLAALLLMAGCLPVTWLWLSSTAQITNNVDISVVAVSDDLVPPADYPGPVTVHRIADPNAKLVNIPPERNLNGSGPTSLEATRLVAARSPTEVVPIVPHQVEPSVSHSATPPWPRLVAWVCTIVYLFGVTCILVRLLVATYGGIRLRYRATPLASDKLLELCRRRARQLGLRYIPRIAFSPSTDVPALFGFFCPLILLPATLITGIPAAQFDALITHELAHVRRHDMLINLLQRTIEAVLFFHPAVWHVSRCISYEREACCDDLVLTTGWKKFDYATALINLAERCASMELPTAGALAATGNRPSELKARIHRLLDVPATSPTRPSLLSVAAVALMVIGLIATPLLLQTRNTLADATAPAESAVDNPSLEEQLRAENAELTYATDSGDIVALRLRAETTDELLARLAELPALTRLFIENAGRVTDTGLQHIAALNQLESLQLVVMNLTEAGIAHISQLPNLIELQMHGCRLDDQALVHLAKMTQLTSLRLGHNLISDAGITHLRHLTNLRELDISSDGYMHLNITDKGFQQLSELHELRSLSTTGTRITYQGLRVLANFPKLQQLAVGGLSILGRLESIVQLTELRELTLLRPNTGDEDFAQIRNLTKLTHLRITSQELTTAGFSHLQHLPRLETLDVRSRLIDNDGLTEIAKIKTLKQLHLYGSLYPYDAASQRFDAEGYRHLAGLKGLKELYLYNLKLEATDLEPLQQLKRLHVGCTSLTDAEFGELEKSLPDTRVTLFTAIRRRNDPSAYSERFARDLQQVMLAELILDKPQFFLGENILLHYRVTNKGNTPFRVDIGSDGRNPAARPLRFKVVATDPQGQRVEDPYPRPADFGGMGGQVEIAPGGSLWVSLPLTRYCNFEKPGIYKLQVFHDLGWETDQKYEDRQRNELPKVNSVAPILDTTIRLVAPTAEQAKMVVQTMRALSTDRNATFARRVSPYADYQAIRYPLYLPVLEQVLATGDKNDEWAVEAIAGIHTPPATTALIHLVAHESVEIRTAATKWLLRRVPDQGRTKDLVQSFYGPQVAQMQQRCWSSPAHQAAVLEIGWRLLESEDRSQMIQGATVIGKLGSAAVSPRLVTLLDKIIYDMATVDVEQHAYPRPPTVSMSSINAGWQLAERGAAVDTTPETRGEQSMFLMALGKRPDFRPAGWEATLQRLIRHPIPVLRALALENMPRPIPESLQESLLLRINDRAVPVQAIALRLAGESQLPIYLEAIRTAKANASDEWIIKAAETALQKLPED